MIKMEEEKEVEEEETLMMYHIQPYNRTLMFTTTTGNINIHTMKYEFPVL